MKKNDNFLYLATKALRLKEIIKQIQHWKWCASFNHSSLIFILYIDFATRLKFKNLFHIRTVDIGFSCIHVALAKLPDMQRFHQKLIMVC